MNPVGIFAAIRLTPAAFERFCADHGRELVADVGYIFANAGAQARHLQEIEAFGRTGPSSRDARDFFTRHAAPAYRLTPGGHLHDPGDQMVAQYDAPTRRLFYLHVLNHAGHPAEMAEVPSFRCLQKIAAYKDIDDADVAVFSADMPNFLRGAVWRIYDVTRAGFVERAEGSPLPDTVRADLQGLADKYYFEESASYFLNHAPFKGRATAFPQTHFAPPLAAWVNADPLMADALRGGDPGFSRPRAALALACALAGVALWVHARRRAVSAKRAPVEGGAASKAPAWPRLRAIWRRRPWRRR